MRRMPLGRARRLTAAAILVLALTMIAPTSQALAYSCGFPDNCYGAILWPNVVDGANTTVDVAPLYNNQFGNDTTDELWLMDLEGNEAWYIESGFMSSQGSEQYFWGDWAPGTPSPVVHFFGSVPSGDYGNGAYLELQRDSSSQFHMKVVSNNVNYTAYSFNNSMTPNSIQMGLEVQGTSSAAANGTYFFDNQYVWRGSHIYQTNGGQRVDINIGPTYSYWYVNPANSSTGGIWYTYCGCN